MFVTSKKSRQRDEKEYVFKSIDVHIACMVRQVSLSEEAYERLSRAKRDCESFSDVVLRTVKNPTGNLDRFFGIWKGEDYTSIESRILSDRKACA
jgi:predicted CopG family antitoxin